MKLGINTAFIMTFDVEDGLRFAADLGMHVAEVAACGIAFNNKYCRLDQLMSDVGELHTVGRTPMPATASRSYR